MLWNATFPRSKPISAVNCFQMFEIHETHADLDSKRQPEEAPRDGRGGIKPPDQRHRLSAAELRGRAREALLGREQEFRDYVARARDLGRRSVGRCALLGLRAYCYLSKAKDKDDDDEGGNEGAAEQALRDGRAAVAFAPQVKSGKAHPLAAALRARALAAHGSALEHLGDYPAAAVDLLDASSLLPDHAEHTDARERIASKLSPAQRAAVEKGGSRGLRELIAEQKELALPEHQQLRLRLQLRLDLRLRSRSRSRLRLRL